MSNNYFAKPGLGQGH